MAEPRKWPWLLGAVGIAAAASYTGSWEGPAVLVAKHQYFDPPHVVTYCRGETNYDNPKVRVGDKFTPDFCDKDLQKKLHEYDVNLRKCLFADMPEHRHIAALDFFYNVGQRNACGSTFVRELNAGHVEAAAENLSHWTKANGKVLGGLVHRRTDDFKGEMAWILRGD
jgi:lysozyme